MLPYQITFGYIHQKVYHKHGLMEVKAIIHTLLMKHKDRCTSNTNSHYINVSNYWSKMAYHLWHSLTLLITALSLYRLIKVGTFGNVITSYDADHLKNSFSLIVHSQSL